MVGDVIFKDLDHGHITRALVRNSGFAAETHDIRILDHRSNHIIQRIRENLGIRIDLSSAQTRSHSYHEYGVINIRRQARDFPNPIKNLKLQFRHSLIEHDLLQK
jgi:hypothetical protein